MNTVHTVPPITSVVIPSRSKGGVHTVPPITSVVIPPTNYLWRAVILIPCRHVVHLAAIGDIFQSTITQCPTCKQSVKHCCDLQNQYAINNLSRGRPEFPGKKAEFRCVIEWRDAEFRTGKKDLCKIMAFESITPDSFLPYFIIGGFKKKRNIKVAITCQIPKQHIFKKYISKLGFKPKEAPCSSGFSAESDEERRWAFLFLTVDNQIQETRHVGLIKKLLAFNRC